MGLRTPVPHRWGIPQLNSIYLGMYQLFRTMRVYVCVESVQFLLAARVPQNMSSAHNEIVVLAQQKRTTREIAQIQYGREMPLPTI